MRTSVARRVVEIALAAMFMLILASWILLLAPQLAGMDRSYIVVGRSMEPFMRLGDVALVKEVAPQELELGDVVVIDDGIRRFAHRIIEKHERGEELFFRTKGDNSEAPDYKLVSSKQVVGRVEYVIPTSAIRTKAGYIIFVAMPLMVLAANQAAKIYKLLATRARKRKGEQKKMKLFDMISALSLTILMGNFVFALAPIYAPAGALLLDQEEPPAMQVKAATWKVPSTLTCNANKTDIQLGEAVEIYGHLNPPRAGERIHLTYSMNETVITALALTDNGASYHGSFQPPAPGIWEVTVSWSGSEWYYPSSCKLSIRVWGE